MKITTLPTLILSSFVIKNVQAEIDGNTKCDNGPSIHGKFHENDPVGSLADGGYEVLIDGQTVPLDGTTVLAPGQYTFKVKQSVGTYMGMYIWADNEEALSVADDPLVHGGTSWSAGGKDVECDGSSALTHTDMTDKSESSGTLTVPSSGSFVLEFKMMTDFVGGSTWYYSLLNFDVEEATTTPAPSITSSSAPTDSLTLSPSGSPSSATTPIPSDSPSAGPTPSPSRSPSSTPTQHPSASSTSAPIATPSSSPSTAPTQHPSASSTSAPIATPSLRPSSSPSSTPTQNPSTSFTSTPTSATTSDSSSSPSSTPTQNPSTSFTSTPTSAPTSDPSSYPSSTPTRRPSASFTSSPATTPMSSPSSSPTLPPISTTSSSRSSALVFSGSSLMTLLFLSAASAWIFVIN